MSSINSFTTAYSITPENVESFIWAHDHATVVETTPEALATLTDHLTNDEVCQMLIDAGMPDPL